MYYFSIIICIIFLYYMIKKYFRIISAFYHKPGESKNSLLYLKERGLLIGAGMIGIFIFEIPEIKCIWQYDGLFFCTVFCPNQFCELRDGKILCVSGDDDGGTGSFFEFLWS